ncbi:protein cramped-like isoform X1 [Chiloscyllium plagiosum]|uniref:protein cramped-like isoform X1 n=2 Tax=Chiloscyllium plagiosum TaxID=36176 RepID=UPI001CB8862D|nr:protein cramped-like isoform X1 [Chiloscyllium plagiosum]
MCGWRCEGGAEREREVAGAGMTAKCLDVSSDEGLKRLGKRSVEEDSAEGDGESEEGGSSSQHNTKREDPSAVATSPDQHHFLRSSVRPPSKRLRKDSSALNGSSGFQNNKGKGPEGGAAASGYASGIAAGSTGGSSKTTAKSLSSISGEKEEGNKKKVRRQWESWSAEDKNSFFEGLYEHGKDFEAIQNNIALKYKKKGKPASMVKNKEQVRHFYYRTWHKISKYIDFNNVFSRGLKKSSQELYGLICYGELRKKIGGCMDDKNAAKLNELIQAGATTVRYKGRNLRIKTPMCRALKKICDPEGISDEEDQKPVRLPLKVLLELLPRSNYTWARVQSLAQNPRLRMMVELHRKVSSLIEFLKHKWALQEFRIRKSLEERQQDSGDNESRGVGLDEKTELHLYPAENCTLTALPGVAKVVHSKACCTVHWQETGRCRQTVKDTHLHPPAQTLAKASVTKDVMVPVNQGAQGTMKGPVKQMRATIEGRNGNKMSGLLTGEGTQNTEDELPPSEGISAEEAAVQQDSPKPEDFDVGQQELGENGESLFHSPKSNSEVSTEECNGNEATVMESSEVTTTAELCVCGGIMSTDEISLLDPVPRYMKSCQNLVVPERCTCKAKSSEKDVTASHINGFSGDPSAVHLENVEMMELNNEKLAISGSQLANDTTLKSPSLTTLDDGDNRTIPSNCTREQPVSCTQEVSETDCLMRQASIITVPSQGQPSSASIVPKPLKEDSTHLAQQVQEDGWSQSTSENLTLAELYLMLGKPNKLQLEYDWVQTSRNNSEETERTRGTSQRLLKCLLQIISTEVNPKPNPESSSVATSPMKLSQDDQMHTPPGKVITLARSPGCVRNAAAVRCNKTVTPTATSGMRNVQKTLVVPCSSGSSGSSSNDADSGVFAVPTILPPNSRHNKIYSPSKETDLTFRQRLDSFSRPPDIYLPKQRKLRNNRPRKPLVVQRTLLPRPTGNSSQHVCSFSILSNSATGTGSFRPLQSSLSKASLARPIVPKAIPASTSQLSSAIDMAAKTAGIIPGSPIQTLDSERPQDLTTLSTEGISIVTSDQELSSVQENGSNTETTVTTRELEKHTLQNGLPSPSETSNTLFTSPPNVSALLDISLPGPPDDTLSQGGPHSQISDSIIELAINSTQYVSGDGASLSPTKLNGGDNSKSLPSPSASPQRNWIPSPTHDPQWFPNDSGDSSLGSLLSSLISPEKGRKMLTTGNCNSNSNSLLGTSLLDGNSRDSFVSRSLVDVSEVDSQLVCMMNESSVDYIARFNDLAQELSVAETSRKEMLFDSSPPIGDLSQ